MKENIISLLSEEELKKTITKSFKKGQIIKHEETSCSSLFCIIKGSVKISSYAMLGNEVIYNIVTENDMFGNNLLFASDNHFRGNVIANTDCVITEIKKDDLIGIFKENTPFLLRFLQYESDFGKTLNLKIKLISISSAEERLLYFIQVNGGTIKFDSVTSLAHTLFLQRETVSRTLSKLEREKKIFFKSNNVVSVD